jgi:hypothetical protein
MIICAGELGANLLDDLQPIAVCLPTTEAVCFDSGFNQFFEKRAQPYKGSAGCATFNVPLPIEIANAVRLQLSPTRPFSRNCIKGLYYGTDVGATGTAFGRPSEVEEPF